MSTVTPETKREGRDFSESHLREAQILRFLEGTLSENEAENVQAHLDSCRECFDLFSTAVKFSLNPPTAEEASEFEKLYRPAPERRLEKLFAVPPAGRVQPNSLAGLPKPFLPKAPKIPSYWRPILAAAAAVLLGIFAGMPQYDKWRSNNLAEQAFVELSSDIHFDSAEQPRPAGSFKYDEFKIVRNQERVSQNQPALQKLQSALAIKNDNPRAHQYLGTYYLLVEQDLQKAEEHYNRANTLAPGDASILNDLGVLAWHKLQYDDALDKFSAALQQSPRFAEAQYNLATLYQKQGKLTQAENVWQKYLEIDSTSTWASVARDQLTALRGQ